MRYQSVVYYAGLGVLGLAAVVAAAGMLLENTTSADRMVLEYVDEFALVAGYLDVIGMLAFLALERGRWKPVARIGLWLVLASILCESMNIYCHVVHCEWAMEPVPGSWSDWYELFEGLTFLLVFVASYWCLLALVLMPRFKVIGQVVQGLTAVAMSATVVLVLAGTSGISRAAEDIALITLPLSGAGALTVLGLSRLPIMRQEKDPFEVTRAIWVRCPLCLTEQEITVGNSRCRGCRLRLSVDVEEPRCTKCGYIVWGLTSNVCPECGTPVGGAKGAVA